MSKKQEETNVWKQMQLDLSPDGFRLFRNQRYKGYTDKGFFVDAGIGGNGGGDLVGYKIMTITQDMVGKKIAQYTEIEAKTSKGRPSDDQLKRINRLTLDGGIAGICTCADDVKKLLTLN